MKLGGKKTLAVAAALVVVAAGAIGGTVWAGGFGDKADDGTMTLEEALAAAKKSAAVTPDQLTDQGAYNATTETWWLDLNIQKPGCAPALVVNARTSESEINWRCTGALMPDIHGEQEPQMTEGVALKVGETYEVTLDSNPSTGYSWKATFDESRLKLVEQKFTSGAEAGQPVVGAGGKETLLFQALSSGTTQVQLAYQRPWESGNPAETKFLDFTIQ